MPSDKDINIRLKTTADTSGAEAARQALDAVEDRLRQIENEGEAAGKEARIASIRQAAEALRDEIGGQEFSADSPLGQHAAERVGAINSELDELNSSYLDFGETLDQHAAKVKAQIEASQKAAAALEKEAKAAKKLDDINIAQHVQLMSQYATGIRALSRIARRSGLEEFADHLNGSADAMDAASSAAAAGLNLKRIVDSAGGARAALGKLTAFLAGPVGAAALAATAAYMALKLAVDNAAAAMDEMNATASKPSLFGEESAKRSKEAVDELSTAIDGQLAKMDELLEKHKEELAVIRRKKNEKLAEVDAGAAEEMALIDAAEAAGEISEPEAIARRAKIDQQVADAKHRADAIARKKELDLAAENAAGNKAAIAAMEKARADYAAKLEVRGEGATTEEKEEFRRLTEKASRISAELNNMGGLYNYTPTGIRKKKEAQDKLNALNKRRDDITEEVNAAGGRIYATPKSAKQVAEEDKRIARAKNRQIELEKERRKLEADNASAQREADIRHRGETNARSIRTGTSVATAAERQQRELEKEREKERRRKAEAERGRLTPAQDSTVESAAAEAERLAGMTNQSAAGQKLNAALKQLAKRLSDGTDSAELAELNRVLAASSSSQLTALKQLIATARQQQAQIDLLVKHGKYNRK